MFPPLTTVTPGIVVCFTNYQTVCFLLSRSILECNVTLRLPIRLRLYKLHRNVFFFCVFKSFEQKEKMVRGRGSLSSDYSQIW